MTSTTATESATQLNDPAELLTDQIEQWLEQRLGVVIQDEDDRLRPELVAMIREGRPVAAISQEEESAGHTHFCSTSRIAHNSNVTCYCPCHGEQAEESRCQYGADTSFPCKYTRLQHETRRAGHPFVAPAQAEESGEVATEPCRQCDGTECDRHSAGPTQAASEPSWADESTWTEEMRLQHMGLASMVGAEQPAEDAKPLVETPVQPPDAVVEMLAAAIHMGVVETGRSIGDPRVEKLTPDQHFRDHALAVLGYYYDIKYNARFRAGRKMQGYGEAQVGQAEDAKPMFSPCALCGAAITHTDKWGGIITHKPDCYLRMIFNESVRVLYSEREAWNHRAAQPPIAVDMLLFCPRCNTQHIDAPDERTPDWTNPPHKTHLCHGCGHLFRPGDQPTNGVAAIASKTLEEAGFVQPPIAKIDPASLSAERCAGIYNQFQHGGQTNWIARKSDVRKTETDQVYRYGGSAFIAFIYALSDAQIIAAWYLSHGAAKGGTR